MEFGVAVQLLKLKTLGYDVEDPATIVKAEILAEVAEASRRKVPINPPAMVGPGCPVVYYMQIRDTIKIGYTTQEPERRRRQLAGDRVLAIEPGDMALENARHHQFADLRITDIPNAFERFTPGPALLDHIQSIRLEHADMQISA